MGKVTVDNACYRVDGQTLEVGMTIRRYDEVAHEWFEGEVRSVSSYDFEKQQRVSYLHLVVEGYAPSPLMGGQLVEIVSGEDDEESEDAWGERKDKDALKAAEDHVISVYTSCTRNTTKEWAFDDEDLAKLRYNDSPGKRDGYLIAGIASSRVLEYEADDDGEEWTVEVVPDVGFLLDPEEYRVYQADNGDWIVEQ